MPRSSVSSAPLVDARILRKRVQANLNAFRNRKPFARFTALDPFFEDGYWRIVVRPSSKVGGGDYAEVLAYVEEEIASATGINIVLIPAGD